MTDIGNGIYVSDFNSDQFTMDEGGGGFTHLLFDDGRTKAGLWRPNPEGRRVPRSHVLPGRETIVVLAGSVRIEIDGNQTLELNPGDMASLPAGALTTWHPSPDFEEAWIFS